MPYDLIIRDAEIIDGTGSSGFPGDVAVLDGKIAAVGDVTGWAEREIEAEGQVVAPGFIDIHTHMDAQLLWDPLATSSCWHGITTLVMGNCSFGLAPCKPQDRDLILLTLERVEGMSLEALQAGVDWSWETYPAYLDRIGRELGLNVVSLIGHSAVRQYVMGNDASEREATQAEIDEMGRVVGEALAAGAYGISFNFNSSHTAGDGRPIPCRLSSYDEVLTMAAQLGGRDAGVIQVAFNPNPEMEPLDACDEIARVSGHSVWFAPLLQFNSRPEAWKELLARSTELAESGSRVRAMCTPRTIDVLFSLKNAHIFDGLPSWKDVLVQEPDAVMALLARPEIRVALQNDFEDPSFLIPMARDWNMVEVIETTAAHLEQYQRRSISDIAAAEGRNPLDVFLDIALDDGLDALFLTVIANSDEAAAGEILENPYSVIGLSDAGAHAALECGYGFSTHLLGHWVRDRKLMTLPEAVRKLTSQLADTMGLVDRGRIAEGLAADLVVFDPDRVASLPPTVAFDLPGGAKRFIQKSVGISYTIVNGQILMEGDTHTGAYPGRVLKEAVLNESNGP